jgi:hypothetical protein
MNIPKWIWGIAVMLIAALLVLFLWKEHLTTGRSITDQKLTNFFLSLGAIAAVPALFFLAGQLREMQRAALAAVRPEIYPSNATFDLIYHDVSVGGKTGEQPIPSNLYNTDNPIQTIANIGIGAAKSISAEWIYNKDEVNMLAGDQYLFFPRMGDGVHSFTSFLKANATIGIHPPLHYFTCCGKALNLKSVYSGFDGVFGLKPLLQLRISYQNIYDQTFERTFNVDVQAYNDRVLFYFSAPVNL